jgi:hypothetical protein
MQTTNNTKKQIALENPRCFTVKTNMPLPFVGEVFYIAENDNKILTKGNHAVNYKRKGEL